MNMRKKLLSLVMAILVFTLIAVILALVTLIPKEKYTVPFEVDSVKTIDIYLFSESIENGRKIITERKSIASLLAMIDNMGLEVEYHYSEPVVGGHFFGIVFNLVNGESFSCAYSQTSEFGSGYFSDGNCRKRVSNFDLLDFWNTLDSELLPSQEGIAFPQLWD